MGESGGIEMLTDPVGKFVKIQHNLCPANGLRPFRSSFLFACFHPF